MADLDHQFSAAVRDQADWVNRIRLGFEILTGLALAAYLHEERMRLRDPSPLGLKAAWNFACIVSAIGLLVAIGMIVTVGVFSGQNADKANELRGQYQDLVGGSS